MSLQEAKELFGTLIFGSTVISLAILYVLYKFAEVSYKKAHKTAQKQHRSVQNKTEIIYNLGDTKNMTLQEIQALKLNMKRSLKGAM